MGLYDRDYMRRPPDDERRHDVSPDERLEAGLRSGWRRHRKLLIALGVCFLVLLLAAVLNAILTGH